MRKSTIRVIAAGLVAGALAFCPGARRAEACGGLFCNGPPADPFAPLPVAQSGENIVFAVDNPGTGSATVTAYIQILYSGLASQFSWVIPIDAVPTISVGTDRIFTMAAQRTRPTYGANWITEGTCRSDPRSMTDSAGGPTAGGGTGSGGAGGVVTGPGVNVAFRGDVGPYDVSVIQSASSAALLKWLSDNGYFVGDAAKTIIEEYVALNKYFVAVKLLSGQETGAIQPIVLRFAGEVPCVPLKLTAIAALADLQVNLWVLGASRAVPSNYFEITLNQAKIDWLNGGTNYTDMVKTAADAAGGNAFIAEYAGTARLLDGTLWPNTTIDLATLGAATTPPAFLQLVVAQGLLQYGPMLPLLRTYIPEPQVLKDMGITESQFYNGNATYWAQNQSSFAPFDASTVTMLTTDIKAKIVDPLQAGQQLIDAHTYLTRLATYISPEEMNKDPEFVFNPDLPELSNVHTATAHVMCGQQTFTYCQAPIRLDLPEGGSVWFTRTSCAPDRTGLDQMPSLSVAYLRAEAGEGTAAIDNRASISAAIASHNDTVTGCGCNVAPGASAGALALLCALALLRRARPSRRRE